MLKVDSRTNSPNSSSKRRHSDAFSDGTTNYSFASSAPAVPFPFSLPNALKRSRLDNGGNKENAHGFEENSGTSSSYALGLDHFQSSQTERSLSSTEPPVNTPFKPTNLGKHVLDHLEEDLPRKLRRKAAIGGSDSSCLLFSMDEVRQILSVALETQEKKLRVEYDRILQEKLHEQFQRFNEFNQHYIARQMARSDDCDYIS